MKDAALILNPAYKDQAIQTNISYDQQQGHFVAQDNPRLVKYCISIANSSTHTEHTITVLALVITYHSCIRTSVPYQR